jgi:hypothetical protein
MGKKRAETIEVTCPCCHAKLTVDPQLAAVLSHEAPPKAAPEVDLDDAARILAEQERAREEKYRQSVEAEKKKDELFDRLFEEGLKKAKKEPITKPIRDFDLD